MEEFTLVEFVEILFAIFIILIDLLESLQNEIVVCIHGWFLFRKVKKKKKKIVFKYLKN